MQLRLVREAFDDADFIFELKQDGFRGLVYIEDQQCRLVSRNQRSLQFASLKTTLANSRLPHGGVKKACQSLLFKSQDVSRSCERGLISR
jgi:hypothetical protein